MKKLSLEEFIADPSVRNSYIWFQTLHAYYMKGPRVIHGARINIITRGNTTNKKRAGNIDYNPKAKSTGLYRALDQHTHAIACKYGYEGVLVENVMNDFLPNKLLEYGYERIIRPGIDIDEALPSYFKYTAKD